MSDDNIPHEFKTLVDSIVAAGHTCQTVLLRVDARIAVTPAGSGRDNLMEFRRLLIEKIERGASEP